LTDTTGTHGPGSTPTAEPLSAAGIFYGPYRWWQKASMLTELVGREPSEEAKRYLARANSAAKFTWEAGDLDFLQPDGTWKKAGDPDEQPYGLIVREQSGAIAILEQLGAMEEIADAITDHCEQFRPDPPYKPELLKARLAERGWLREQRVPPPSPELDHLPINDRYDALKFFPLAEGEAGVAIEIEGWEISNDLLKFWRGHTRGQIVVGVLVQPDPGTVRYCFEQMRLLTEPLFRTVPVAYFAPDGPGLKQSTRGTRQPKYASFPMPRS
jgi:hypothetical protein